MESPGTTSAGTLFCSRSPQDPLHPTLTPATLPGRPTRCAQPGGPWLTPAPAVCQSPCCMGSLRAVTVHCHFWPSCRAAPAQRALRPQPTPVPAPASITRHAVYTGDDLTQNHSLKFRTRSLIQENKHKVSKTGRARNMLQKKEQDETLVQELNEPAVSSAPVEGSTVTATHVLTPPERREDGFGETFSRGGNCKQQSEVKTTEMELTTRWRALRRRGGCRRAPPPGRREWKTPLGNSKRK